MLVQQFINKFRAEGVDHIRIHPFADTRMGKILSSDWRQKFFIPHMGEFTSPVCFANWLATGDEDARHNVRFKVEHSVKGYLNFIGYAKFFQLCAMRGALQKDVEQIDLPWVSYKIHAGGVKEFDRWKEYPEMVKAMTVHVCDPDLGPKVPYPWDEKLLENIQALIKKNIVPEEPAAEEAANANVEEPAEEQPAVTRGSARKNKNHADDQPTASVETSEPAVEQ